MVMNQNKTALICGVNGQDGTYLAKFLLAKGYNVFGTSRNINNCNFDNLKKLDIHSKISLLTMKPDSIESVSNAIKKSKPDEVYYLAGQSSVGASFLDPSETITSILIGTLNLLDAIRNFDKKIKLYQAGSSESFGNTSGIAANEKTQLNPTSPYGIAKASAYWLIDNYRKSYNLFACTGILFNHESPLRPINFVTQKIISSAGNIANGSREKLILGNLAIERDWGWAPEYVEAMWLMLQQEIPEDFVIATGKTNTLEKFVSLTFEAYDLDWKKYVVQSDEFYRPTDLMISNADPTYANDRLGWRAKVDINAIILSMVNKKY